MLTEKRQAEILSLLKEKGSVTVQELKELFQASESTIRRDLNTLDKKGALVKVFGGAVSAEAEVDQIRDEKVALRSEIHMEEKRQIAKVAAALVEPDDFVYIDAGTTTGCMIPYLTEESAVFVTNAVSHALQLAERGFRVTLIGGEVKSSTEAIVGNEAAMNLQKFNFTKGFFGTNAVNQSRGFTTPDINEAMIKECAMKHTKAPYVVCDSSKFEHISPVAFGEFEAAKIITEKLPGEKYRGCSNLIIAEE